MESLEQQWWIEYRRGDHCARDHLLQKYLPFARRLTNILYSRRPPSNAEFGDYLHLAYLGLLEAMQRYQHETNAAFSTFAAYRIRGAILNGIPKMSERGEYVSYLRRAQRERTESLLASNSKFELDFSQTVDLIVSIALTHQLDELSQEGNQKTDLSSDPYLSRSYEQVQDRLLSAVSTMQERDRQIIYYHYFCYMSFEDIAALLHLSKGRISQLHKKILLDVREKLSDIKFDFAY